MTVKIIGHGRQQETSRADRAAEQPRGVEQSRAREFSLSSVTRVCLSALAVASIGGAVLGDPAAAASTSAKITLAPMTTAPVGLPFLVAGQLQHTGTADDKTVVLLRRSGSHWVKVAAIRHMDDGPYRILRTEMKTGTVVLRTKVLQNGHVLDISSARHVSVQAEAAPPPPPPPPPPSGDRLSFASDGRSLSSYTAGVLACYGNGSLDVDTPGTVPASGWVWWLPMLVYWNGSQWAHLYGHWFYADASSSGLTYGHWVDKTEGRYAVNALFSASPGTRVAVFNWIYGNGRWINGGYSQAAGNGGSGSVCIA